MFFLITAHFLVFLMVNGQNVAKPPFSVRKEVLHYLPQSESAIPGEYLVMLKSDVVQEKARKEEFTNRLSNEFNMDIQKEYTIGSVTFLFVKSDDDNVAKVEQLSEIAHVSQNRKVSASQTILRCEKRRHPYTWGLDRIDQRERLHGGSLEANATYTFGYADAGQGVSVYVVDSGVDVQHPEFQGRAVWGHVSVGMDGQADLNGHGTHVAGTVGSESYGVAKKTKIVAVKVLNKEGKGTTLNTMDGLYWVYNDHIERLVDSGHMPKSVINLSLGSFGEDAVYIAVISELVAQGINVVIAAGNDDDNACQYNHVEDAITVGASDVNDSTTSFTNWGDCVDIFAPGDDIISTYPRSLDMDGYEIWPGTSMAAPHVAGVIARYLSTRDEAPSPHDVTKWLLNSASQGALKYLTNDHAKSPNRLLFMTCHTSVNAATNVGSVAMVTVVVSVVAWIGTKIAF